jgi:4-hydroxybenzoate polyprenyltransferase
MNLRAALALLRPAHWVKNTFVLAGIFFAGKILDVRLLGNVALAFAAFCMASSAIYALNDVLDRKLDARHPRKRRRPVASGAIGMPAAVVLSGVCGIAAISIAALVGGDLLAIIGCYLAINIAYTRWLKHRVLLDVFCIASGFLLRLLAGTRGVGIPPSQWFVLCTFLLSLFLGFSKRYAERMDDTQDPESKRAVVKEYSPEFLRMLLAVTLACTLMTYGLYTMNPVTVAFHGTERLIYTLPFAAFVMFRYLYLVMAQGYGENLAREFLRDVPLWGGGLLYAGFTGFILFSNR